MQKYLSVGLLAFAGLAAPASASVYTVAGYTWDTANGFTAASGTVAGNNNATPFPALNAPASDGNFSLGRLLGFGVANANRRVTLGNSTLRNTVTLTGNTATNNAGADLVVYEQGDPGQPEAFAISVRLTGSGSYSDFYYVPATVQTALFGGAVYFAHAFDLSVFGVANGASIDSVRVMNLLSTDTVSINTTGSLGYGFVNTTGGFTPDAGSLATYAGGIHPVGEFDPDITYVAVLIPTPGAAALLGLGGLALGARRRR